MDHLHDGDKPGLAAPQAAASLGAPGVPSMDANDARVFLTPYGNSASGEAGRIEEQSKHNDSHFLTAEANRKAIFTLIARCALLGVSLSQIQDDGGRPLFIASQRAWTRDLHSLEEVDAFLRRLGGPKA